MSRSGLYSGFESYRVLTAEDIRNALQNGIVALDTNVLLNLYRYNDKTVGDLLRWRRQPLIGSSCHIKSSGSSGVIASRS